MPAHLVDKRLAAELARMSGDRLRIDLDVGQPFHSSANRLDRLFGEENTGNAVDDGFRRAASAKCDYRTPTRHRFYRHHPEIFFAWKNQRAASRVMLPQDVKRLSAHDRDGWAGNATDFIQHFAAADHNQL